MSSNSDVFSAAFFVHLRLSKWSHTLVSLIYFCVDPQFIAQMGYKVPTLVL